jgi:hypothetical protein
MLFVLKSDIYGFKMKSYTKKQSTAPGPLAFCVLRMIASSASTPPAPI